MAGNFAAYWRRLCSANKSLTDDASKITLTAASLQVQLLKAYTQGAVDSRELVDELDKEEKRKNPFGGVLGKMFGQ